MLSSKLWHRFLVFLPVVLILSMIGMIYITYLATYIGVLINSDIANERNFLLSNTSSIKNAPGKGYTLLFITLIFLTLLVWAILKTVFTNPGYFPEPMDLEYKLISTSIENLLEDKSHKCSEEAISETADLSPKSITVPKNEKKKNSGNRKDYSKLDDEFEIVNNSNFAAAAADKNIKALEKSSNNSNFAKSLRGKKDLEEKSPREANLVKDVFDKRNSKVKLINNYNNNLNKSNPNSKLIETHNLIVNFTSSVTEGPLNYYEYNEYHKSIDKFYDSCNSKIHEEIDLESQIISFSQKTNEEIIEANKIKLMNKQREEEEEKNNKKTKLGKKKEKQTSFDITDLYKGVDISRLNQCGTCQRIKIERSHHCKMCQKCVLKMDHHCPWLANCIGFFNYKYFCLIHFYGSISTGLIFLTFWETIANFHLNYNTHIFECVFVDFVFMTNFALMAFLVWLLWVNAKLVLNGETIIEQSDRERFPSSKSFNVYDMGWKRNFVNVFGEKWYTWFIPAYANLKGNGLMFETKKNFFINN